MAQETISPVYVCYYCRKPVNGNRRTLTRKGKTYLYCSDEHLIKHIQEFTDYENESQSLF
jgi:YHS domain-containing protein